MEGEKPTSSILEEAGSRVEHHSNNANKQMHWIHPKYRAALELMDECNNIKYAAYRTASKLSVMQRNLGLEYVRLGVFSGVFQRHRIQATENSLTLDYSELEAIISDIFFAASKEATGHRIPVNTCTQLTLSFLLDIYDTQNQNKVNVLGAKVALVCLCSSRLQEKYQYLFSQVADHNNCLSRRKLQALLNNLVLITDYFSESLAFSAELIPMTIESCFQQSHGPMGISEDVFMGWLMREPQLLVWLPTFYRLRAAEKVSHGVRCGVCRTYPIVGLRYRCLRCLSYDQCQSCFFHGCLSKRHKLKHPMQEYCWETSTGEATMAFLKALVNRLCGNTSRLQYLPVQMSSNDDGATNSESTGDSTISTENSSLASSVDSVSTPHLQPQKELHSIISQLERQIESLYSSSPDMNTKLQQHRLLLETQVHRLKHLKNQLHVVGSRQIGRMQSTPVLTASRKQEVAGFQELSPILKNVELTVKEVPSQYDTASLSEITSGAISSWFGGRKGFENKKESGFSQWLWSENDNILKKNDVVEDDRVLIQKSPCSDDEHTESLYSDLDNIMDKLQKMLASNFSLTDNVNKQGYSPLKIGSS